MHFEFNDFLDNLIKLVGALTLPILALFVQRWVAAYESMAKTRYIMLKRQQVHGAADVAAGTLFVALARGVIRIDQVRMGTPPMLEAARHAASVVPDAIEALALDREDMEQMIIGKIGAMLPMDPTVQTLLTAPEHQADRPMIHPPFPNEE